ncbi:MAG: hypothetical protein ABJC51_00920 [Acidobacteriota bacterium]
MNDRRLLTAVLTLLMFLSAARLSAHDRFRFIGTVVKMDMAKKLLTMKTGRKDHPPQLEIDVTAKTRIEKDGHRVTSAELRPGRYVVIDASGDDMMGTEALLIRIVPPPATQPSGKHH